MKISSGCHSSLHHGARQRSGGTQAEGEIRGGGVRPGGGEEQRDGGEMGTKSLRKTRKRGENLTKMFEEDVEPQRGFRC